MFLMAFHNPRHLSIYPSNILVFLQYLISYLRLYAFFFAGVTLLVAEASDAVDNLAP